MVRRSGFIRRQPNKRVLTMDARTAGEGLKVDLMISPTLLRALAYQWPPELDGRQPPIRLQPDDENLLLEYDGRAVYEVVVWPATEDVADR